MISFCGSLVCSTSLATRRPSSSTRWSTSLSSGYQSSTYRFANTNPTTETATATWSIPVLEDGLYPVPEPGIKKDREY